jgi:hypothetical protein
MYAGYILRMLRLKKSKFSVHRHFLLSRTQILIPECHLVTARFDLMVITAKLIMNS